MKLKLFRAWRSSGGQLKSAPCFCLLAAPVRLGRRATWNAPSAGLTNVYKLLHMTLNGMHTSTSAVWASQSAHTFDGHAAQVHTLKSEREREREHASCMRCKHRSEAHASNAQFHKAALKARSNDRERFSNGSWPWRCFYLICCYLLAISLFGILYRFKMM